MLAILFSGSFRRNWVESFLERFKCLQDFMQKFFRYQENSEWNILHQKSEKDFKESEGCWFCDNSLNEEEQRVCDEFRDHCHTTVKIRGAVNAHCILNPNQSCSVLYQYLCIKYPIRIYNKFWNTQWTEMISLYPLNLNF